MKILFHNVASKPDGCTIIAAFEVKKGNSGYYGAVFEIKKEIPDRNLLWDSQVTLVAKMQLMRQS
jgi:hypothetical protein